FPMVRTSPLLAKYRRVETRRNLTKPLHAFGGAESQNATRWAYMALCSTNSTTRSSTTRHEGMRKPAIQMAPIFASRLVPTMATISRAKATLRIMGDSLIPEEVTSMLGGTPTEAQ